MSKPDFNAMSRKQLRDFILAHRDDTRGLLDEAVHTAVLLIENNPDAIAAGPDEDPAPYINLIVEREEKGKQKLDGPT